ncbi:zinc finger protein 708-like [Ostrinia furnacalis]|uniref:zinc finger protein 708-like n=1 Tax=Ostrinia furnacalis TaxID=93504 RepID=UPI001039E037|nr:zinc finger protein 708-like [Ostrinia furnacalis]
MEEEIKIEYYEIEEQDPLSQEANSQILINKVTRKEPSLITISGDNYIVNVDNESAEITENVESVPNKQGNRTLIELNEFHIISSSVDRTNNTKVVEKEYWYKSIDSSGKYVCKFCNHSYSTVTTLRYHVQNKHPIEGKELKEKIAKTNHSFQKCYICQNTFGSLEELQRHMKTNHLIEENTFCHKCQVVFVDNESLVQHLKIVHKLVGSKLYSCLMCGYKTHKLSHYNQHQKNHSEIKMHKCELCSYATNNASNFKIHKRIHEKSNKPYKCEQESCRYSTASLSALYTHKLIHNKEDNFIYCDKCTYKTVYKQSMTKHLDSHARDTIKTTFIRNPDEI